jgi:hypothetical protein
MPKILQACQHYFANNPYDLWFRRLDVLISNTRASYYFGNAAHLDLVPYATLSKWSTLKSQQRGALLHASGRTLLWLLRESPIRVLILNGASVVSNFQSMFGVDLEKTLMPSWALRPDRETCVRGYSYTGRIREAAGVSFKRGIMVLGFNHNIQSSFGMTSGVASSIQRWIGLMSEKALGAA